MQFSSTVEPDHQLSSQETRSSPPKQFTAVFPVLGFVLAATLPFLITVNTPLLHDSYAHIFNAAHQKWSDVLRFFLHPSANDLFFRPLVYLTYWLDFKWAGYDSTRWHICNLAFHAVNTFLVYLLTRNLSFSSFSSTVASLVFALHGSRPEEVAWAAARFDLLAAFFVFLSSIALNRHMETGQARWRFAMILCAVLALMSKESAYCLPFLALGMLPFKTRRDRRNVLQNATILCGVSTILFAYRCWITGGIGGYGDLTGKATVLQFSIIRTVKGLLFRQWAFLFFPVNWSTDLTAWLRVAVILMLLVMLALVLYSKPDPKIVLAAILIVVLADFPVHHLLLMTADLAGARVLYLPVLGIALFWAILLEGCKRGFTRAALASGLLLFQLAALCHNLLVWREAAFLAQRACLDIGAELRRDGRPIAVTGLPVTWHGVFFLRDGFPQCVAVNSGQNADRIDLYEQTKPVPAGARSFRWSSSADNFEAIPSRYPNHANQKENFKPSSTVRGPPD